jgi:hypothetical protein
VGATYNRLCGVPHNRFYESRGVRFPPATHQADRSSTVAAVKIVVDTLTERGYQFITADRLVATPAYTRLRSRI